MLYVKLAQVGASVAGAGVSLYQAWVAATELIHRLSIPCITVRKSWGFEVWTVKSESSHNRE